MPNSVKGIWINGFKNFTSRWKRTFYFTLYLDNYSKNAVKYRADIIIYKCTTTIGEVVVSSYNY